MAGWRPAGEVYELTLLWLPAGPPQDFRFPWQTCTCTAGGESFSFSLALSKGNPLYFKNVYLAFFFGKVALVEFLFRIIIRL
jgi:hypothetical protein